MEGRSKKRYKTRESGPLPSYLISSFAAPQSNPGVKVAQEITSSSLVESAVRERERFMTTAMAITRGGIELDDDNRDKMINC